MKKILLMLVGLIMLSASACAYNTVVTLTITNITNAGAQVSSFTPLNYTHVGTDCKLSGNWVNTIRVNTIAVGDSFSFLCSPTSGSAYVITIIGHVGTSIETSWGNVSGGYDRWNFPFVAD